MICPFLHIQSHAHAMLVEQVMALHGRGSPDPKQYRRTLECMSDAALQRAIDESDFPALPETANEIQRRSQTPGATTPAREILSIP